MMEEQQETNVTIVESTVQDLRQSARYTTVWALGLTSVAFLGVVGYAVYEVRQYLPYLGYVALGATGLLIVCIVAAPIIFFLRVLFKSDSHAIPQYGLAFKSLFGKPEIVAPHAPASSSGVKYAQEKKRKDEPPTIPMLSMLEMIEQGFIAPGQTRVVMGYTKTGELEARKRPNVYSIIGKGRSGKSRRATLMIGQDLIALASLLNLGDRRAGARVMICDPHGVGKRDSIRKLLEPLAPWVEFASTEQEVRRLVSEYIEEMEARLAGTSTLGSEDGHYLPWVIYFDEWSRFMTKYEDDFTELLINCVQSSSQEYAGVDGYVALLGQDWTQDACGGTAIRRAIQEVFIHNISSEYAKFFLKGMTGNRWATKAESLRVKDCIYKDYEGQIKELVTPHVADEVPARLADLMQQLCPVAVKELPTYAEGLAKPKEDARTTYEQEEYAQGDTRVTGPLREQIAVHRYLPERVSQPPIHEALSTEQFNELKTMLARELMMEQESRVNALLRQSEQGESVITQGENFIAQGEGFTVTQSTQAEPKDVKYTHEQELAIINAAFQLVRETGKITRSDIMERLGWTRAQWPIIKAVCDKNNIAKQ